MLTEKRLTIPAGSSQGPCISTAHGVLDWRRWLTFSNEVTFAVSVSALWVTLYNNAFWQKVIAALWHPTWDATLFILTLVALTITLHATLLLLIPRRALRIAAGALFVVAALGSYFCNTYGVVLNKDMMRNMVQTDAAEVVGLLNAGMLVNLFLLGILPAMVLRQVRIRIWPRRMRIRQRAMFLGVAWTVSIAGVFAASASYAVFLREYKPLRFMLVPAAPLTSSFNLLSATGAILDHGPLLDPAGTATSTGNHSTRPRVIFMVVGETARAANFSLGGYPRLTNPRLSAIPDLTYYDHASACGTATAISVPCMFSSFDRDHFKVGDSVHYRNLLDTLSAAGVDVEWRDNNAGCKGVCVRIRTLSYAHHSDPQLCPQSYCYDEVMLSDLAQRLDAIKHDTLIVFHQIGSHGPAYAERYPPSFELFKPACHSHELHRCSDAEIRNAYDNTIAYTDHILARQIELLRTAGNIDSMLLYASDHGESLGEHGVYLHGMPYRFAPREQTSVPMLLWVSASMRARLALDTDCLQQHDRDAVSHDNLYHTLLGALGLRNKAYRAEQDLLTTCSSTAQRDKRT
jgi:lipid A ethanolaminephosphotransferase